MKLIIKQSIMKELKADGYDLKTLVDIIQRELDNYDFEGFPLFDIFFKYNGESMFAQGRLIKDYAYCYGIYGKLIIIHATKKEPN